ncbi:MAG: ribosome maturation factor RimP [Oscillospiraceae bacterium]|nr:ribosome maturation factor RimP [Oscillospiraceae bacterium]
MAVKKGGKGKNTVSAVFEIAKPIADSLGLTIWDITYDKEGALRYLRVLIEKPDGYIDMDDCEAMTRPLSAALDEKDPIDEQYMLEVGSPGLGRELKRQEHFERFLECPLRIRYIREKDGIKEFIAVLTAYNRESGSITVETERGTEEILLSETAFVKLYDDEELPDEFYSDDEA